ncbi:MAG: hypothetical protein K6E69_04785 [Treponema sp.]|uniref:hypothetical protein n=1 Tax=Treponema sp. TaxID=166 RepID=UPI00298E6635|nr:hypothetical protein [Treponema sp.]MCR5386417.1 hypothetical protein [Treponema sp.]
MYENHIKTEEELIEEWNTMPFSKNYIIFLCLEDPFKKELPLYTYRTKCIEDGTLEAAAKDVNAPLELVLEGLKNN